MKPQEQAFCKGWVVGKRSGEEKTAREAPGRYDIDEIAAWCQGTVDGARNDRFRLDKIIIR